MTSPSSEPRRGRFPFRPDAFVRLSADDLAPAGDDGDAVLEELKVEKNAITFRISREEAIAWGMVEPTPEEAAELADRAEAFRVRQAAERAIVGPELTLEALLEHLRWTAAYATHRLHPSCWCSFEEGGVSLCSWASEVGFSIDYDKGGRVVDPEVVP